MNNDKLNRDEFTLSLGGMRTITSFAAAPAIAHDRLRQDHPRRVRGSGEQKPRFWTLRRFRAA